MSAEWKTACEDQIPSPSSPSLPKSNSKAISWSPPPKRSPATVKRLRGCEDFLHAPPGNNFRDKRLASAPVSIKASILWVFPHSSRVSTFNTNCLSPQTRIGSPGWAYTGDPIRVTAFNKGCCGTFSFSGPCPHPIKYCTTAGGI